MHQGLKSTDGEGGAKEIGNPNYGQNWLKTEWHVLYELFDSKLGTYLYQISNFDHMQTEK